MPPLVSIIMNIRNGERYLREALDSVLAQNFNDWELIAWDDCSTDASGDIVREYTDSRFRYYLSSEEVPLGEARHRAIQQATGEWLAFLDQDDIWMPSKLTKQMALATPSVGIIYGRALVFYPDGRRRDYDVAHEFSRLPEGNIFSQLFSDACFIAMSSAILRRSAVEQIGGIPPTIKLVPDYYLYTAIAHRYEARAVQDVVCLYRMHDTNLSQQSDPRLYSEPLSVVNQWADYVSSDLIKHRRKSYSSVLALRELLHPETFWNGLRRLITQGSLPWLAERPFIYMYRLLRRKLQRPYWQLTTPSS